MRTDDPVRTTPTEPGSCVVAQGLHASDEATRRHEEMVRQLADITEAAIGELDAMLLFGSDAITAVDPVVQP